MTRRPPDTLPDPDVTSSLSQSAAERSKRTATQVRRATAADLPSIAQMLGRAFSTDPLAVWACRPPAPRAAMLGSIHRARLQQMLAYDEIWISTTGASAALWTPPAQWRANILHNAYLARGLLRPHLLIRVPRLALALLAIQRHHPQTPRHWYLSLLGTDPSAQGQGLASAVLQPVLDSCDRDGVGAYLESSHEANLAFYSRLGFQISSELQLPRGPRVWMMWRKPLSPR
jgi:ribosomal protein S18 acetylase RimI-like enzyme